MSGFTLLYRSLHHNQNVSKKIEEKASDAAKSGAMAHNGLLHFLRSLVAKIF